MDDEKDFLVCLSRKLLLRRTLSFDYRVSFIAKTTKQLKDQLQSFYPNLDGSVLPPEITVSKRLKSKISTPRAIAFIFGGQGPQWWAMGRQLYHSEPIFRQWIDRIDQKFQDLTNEWTLINELLLSTNEQESRINETNIAQPALFAVQVALAAVWYSWNIQPTAIIGHSMGEVAAVFVAGRITLTDAVAIIYHRARLQHRNTRQNGRMLALGMSAEQTHKLLNNIEERRLSIAAINSAHSITLSGDTDILEVINDVVHTLHPNVFRSWLRVENAFHSHQMDRHNIREDLDDTLKDVHNSTLHNQKDMFYTSSQRVSLYSTVTGGYVDENFIFDAKYWWKNIRQTVQFYQSIQTMIIDQPDLNYFLEISPHPVLATSLREILPSNNISILASLKRKNDEQTTMLSTLSHFELDTADWKHWLSTRQYASIKESNTITEHLWTLPAYAFDNIPCWYETKQSVIARRAIHSVCHPLLGVRMWNHISPTWVNEIDLTLPQFRYLHDHRVQEQILLAAACFIEIAIAAGCELANPSTKSIVLEHVRLSQALVLDENEPVQIHTVVSLPSYEFRIYSRRSRKEDYVRKGGMASNDIMESYTDKRLLHNYTTGEWIFHANGTIVINKHATAKSFDIKYLQQKIFTQHTWSLVNKNYHQLYKVLDLRGYTFGPAFQRVRTLMGTKSSVMSHIENIDDSPQYYVHPTFT